MHRVVLSWRAWETLDLTGKEQALTLLRQSVRFCVDSEKQRIKRQATRAGRSATLTQAARSAPAVEPTSPADRKADDAWVEELCQAIYAGNRAQAAEAVAAALAEGFSPADIGEAISLAANRLVLRDPGRDQGRCPASRPAACTAPRSASTPPTRPTPGGTSPASATIATPSPA